MSESKRGAYLGAGVVLAILILFFLHMQGYFHHRTGPGNTPLTREQLAQLKTSVVEEKNVEAFETAVGTVTSKKDTMIASKVPAHIKKIHVKPGQEVKAGQLLITLDDRDLKAKLGQAKSGLQAAKAAKAQAESAYNRYKNLLKTGAVTQAEYEQVEAQYQMASAKVLEAENAIKELNVMLGYTEITAPYSGVVVEKMANEGDFAGPGMPLLRLEDPSHLRLEVFVPESRRKSISPGKTIMVRIDTIDKDIPGIVDEIVPSADPRSRSFLVRINLEQQEGLRSGMFGRCYLPIESRKMILVDPAAVYRVGQLEMVKVVKDDHLETRLVRTGAMRDGKLEVLSGLYPNETVALQDQDKE